MSEPVSSWIWVRRIAAWTLVIGVIAWAGKTSYRVLSHGTAPTPKSTADLAAIPRSTGVDPHLKARNMLNTSRKLLSAGDIATGMAGLEQVTRDDPDSPQAKQALLIMAATYRFTMHQPLQAIATYSDFVRRFPNDRQVPMVVGYLRELYAENNLPDQTDSLLRDILPRLEKDPEALSRVKKLFPS